MRAGCGRRRWAIFRGWSSVRRSRRRISARAVWCPNRGRAAEVRWSARSRACSRGPGGSVLRPRLWPCRRWLRPRRGCWCAVRCLIPLWGIRPIRARGEGGPVWWREVRPLRRGRSCLHRLPRSILCGRIWLRWRLLSRVRRVRCRWCLRVWRRSSQLCIWRVCVLRPSGLFSERILCRCRSRLWWGQTGRWAPPSMRGLLHQAERAMIPQCRAFAWRPEGRWMWLSSWPVWRLVYMNAKLRIKSEIRKIYETEGGRRVLRRLPPPKDRLQLYKSIIARRSCVNGLRRWRCRCREPAGWAMPSACLR